MIEYFYFRVLLINKSQKAPHCFLIKSSTICFTDFSVVIWFFSTPSGNKWIKRSLAWCAGGTLPVLRVLDVEVAGLAVNAPSYLQGSAPPCRKQVVLLS